MAGGYFIRKPLITFVRWDLSAGAIIASFLRILHLDDLALILSFKKIRLKFYE